MVILEDINEAKQPMRDEIGARMREKGDVHRLVRREGLAFVIPGRGVATMKYEIWRKTVDFRSQQVESHFSPLGLAYA
jgi:hypothetical protein